MRNAKNRTDRIIKIFYNNLTLHIKFELQSIKFYRGKKNYFMRFSSSSSFTIKKTTRVNRKYHGKYRSDVKVTDYRALRLAEKKVQTKKKNALFIEFFCETR